VIIISFATIMDGQVLRWYRDQTAVENGDEIMSASRSGVKIYGYVHEVHRELPHAERAYLRLRDGQDVDDVATHTVGLFRRDLKPIERPGPTPCPDGFHWIGQTFEHCDRCSLPARDHDGMSTLDKDRSPFDKGNRWVLRPWEPGEREAVRAKWEGFSERLAAGQ
jgi:hypothetical protein